MYIINFFKRINIAIAKNTNNIDTDINIIKSILERVNPPIRYLCCYTLNIKTCICIFNF